MKRCGRARSQKDEDCCEQVGENAASKQRLKQKLKQGGKCLLKQGVKSLLKQELKSLLKQGILLVYRFMTKVLPVKKDVIVFESNLGRNYTGNPKSIYEEMVACGYDKKYRCYYILDDTNIEIPGHATKVKNNRFFYYYIMATARIWVCDTRFPNYIVKRKQCTYIQTWHGTPLKKLALDLEHMKMAEETLEMYKENFRTNTKTWDYLISQNPFSTKTIRRCFDFKGTILEIGYPRNDVLQTKNNERDIEKLKRQLHLPMDKKIILYAPTWRDDAFYENGSYKFVAPLDFYQLKNALGDEYVMLIKYHYMVREQIDWSIYGGFCIPFDNTYDIASLFLVSDLLITDYSSVMFDYSILKRPMIFYAFDLEQYKDNLRGFYFDFMNEVPGPICKTTEQVIASIHDIEDSFYDKVYARFCKEYHPFDDGESSAKVVMLIEELLQS